MFLFISGAELVFIGFIILLVFGSDRIPEIARTLAKGMKQVRRATDEIKHEIKRSTDIDTETSNPIKAIQKQGEELKKELTEVSNTIKKDVK